MALQRVRHHWVTEQQQISSIYFSKPDESSVSLCEVSLASCPLFPWLLLLLQFYTAHSALIPRCSLLHSRALPLCSRWLSTSPRLSGKHLSNHPQGPSRAHLLCEGFSFLPYLLWKTDAFFLWPSRLVHIVNAGLCCTLVACLCDSFPVRSLWCDRFHLALSPPSVASKIGSI